MSFYLNTLDRLNGFIKLNPDKYNEEKQDIISAFQDELINEEQKQDLLNKIDVLLNNHYNYLQFLQQNTSPNLIINLEEGGEEVHANNNNQTQVSGGRRSRSRSRGSRKSLKKRKN